MQHAACQSGRWGHGGYVFRWSNLCWSSCEKASAIRVWAGNQGKHPCEEGKIMRWSLPASPRRSAQQQRRRWHLGLRLTWVGRWEVVEGGEAGHLLHCQKYIYIYKLCCVKEVNWCCNVTVKRYRQNSETAPHPACFYESKWSRSICWSGSYFDWAGRNSMLSGKRLCR